MNIKHLSSLLTLAVAGLTLAGCSHTGGSSSSSSAPSGTTAPAATASSGTPAAPVVVPPDANPVPAGGVKGTMQIAFVTNNASDYWTIARKGTEDAKSKLPNVNVQFIIPQDGTAATQRQQVDDLLAKGVQGIAISPVDPANETDMLNDAAKKAVVFTQDSDAPQSYRACYIGTDNHAAGLQAGAEIKKALPQGGNIMVFVGKRDAQNAKDRYQGIVDALQGSNIKILDVRTDDADPTRAKSNAADTLVKYPDIAGLVGLWSYNGPAIVSAVKEAGKVGKVKIVCFDEQAETLAGVKDGSISATVVQQPYEMGKQSVEDLAKYLSGDKSFIPANKQITIPTQVINQSNVDAFQAKLAKLRGH